jgi:DNA helicase-2/ATP-dependent DNA helicase PcrA
LNYRSTKKILSLSNNLIKNNQDRVKKELVTNNSEGEHVIIYRGKSQDDEANYVSKQIKMLVEEKKYKYSDIAILYRANYLSRNIESALINSNIPYYLYGGVKFYQRKEIKDILAYLRLLVNDNDELSLKRVLNVPKRSIGQNTIEKISDYANSFNMSFGGALKLSLDLKNELP